MMDPIVVTKDLTKRYGESVIALNKVNLTVKKGEFIAVVGRSGSGKSTLMNIIGCLDSPTSGGVSFTGIPVEYGNQGALVNWRRTVIGFVFQQFNLIPNLTARENIQYPMLFHYQDRIRRTERSDILLEQVGLSERASHYPSELSGGEQQRVAIARALVNNPLLVLADEPTGNLDSRTSEGILELMRELNRVQGTTFLIVTHDSGYASYTDRVIEIIDGCMVL